MKFPKSVHAEGWDQQVYGSGNPVKTNNPALNLKRGFKAGAKPVSLHTPLHGDAPAFTAPVRPAVAAPSIRPQVAPATAAAAGYAHAAAPAVRPAAGASVAAPPPRGSSVPWVVGAGVGVLMIGGAMVMSRNTAPTSPDASTPVVVGQATPSPEDAQLQNAPPSAGAAGVTSEAVPQTTPATEAETPSTNTPPAAEATAPAPKAAAEPPVAKPAPAETRIAQAPAPAQPQPQVWAAKPADKPAKVDAPVIRTLTPQPEVLAQVSPPVVSPAPAPMPSSVTPTVISPPATSPSTAPSALPSPQPAAPVAAASAATVPQLAPPVTPSTPPVATAPLTPPVVAQQAPAPAPATPDPADTSITVQVRQALAADATLATVPIAVSTDHGVVKLEGQAPDAQARERATVVAANTSGVKAVDNRLTLPPVAVSEQIPSRVVAQAGAGR
ncbi:MAG: BON domain-containing protein [Pelomonas sp.]|nr:BON domain-containing protein [Roseateles sp.]